MDITDDTHLDAHDGAAQQGSPTGTPRRNAAAGLTAAPMAGAAGGQADLLDAVPGVVFRIGVGADGAAAFEYASSGAAGLLGISGAELMGSFERLIDETLADERAGLTGALAAALHPPRAGETPDYHGPWHLSEHEHGGWRWVHTFRIRRPGGRICTIRATAVVTPKAGGGVTLTGTLLDATAEREAQELAAEREAMLRCMAEHQPSITWYCDSEHQLMYGSGAWERLTGTSIDQSLLMGWMRLVHPDDIRRVVVRYMRACRERGEFHAEIRILGENGSYRWMHCHGVPVGHRAEEQHAPAAAPAHRAKGRRATDRVLEGYIGSLMDITTQREQADALRQAKAAAEQAALAKGQFLAMMSHELRTPLTALLGFAEVGLEPECRDAERLDCLRTVSRSGKHLLGVINDILDYSKIEAGLMPVVRERCDLVELLRGVGAVFAATCASKGVRLSVRLEPGGATEITTDPQRLRQVLMNLTGNAVKFTDAGSVTVSLQADAARSEVRISVADTGPGMSHEVRSRLFTPFTQGSSQTSRTYGGTGLGLSISRKLAGLLGGSIDVDSSPGNGSTFWLTLPMHVSDPVSQDALEVMSDFAVITSAAAAAARPAIRLSEAPQLATAPVGPKPLAGRRVLVVEDGLDNQRLLQHILVRSGAAVELADNGLMAVDRLLRPSACQIIPDAIIMDMQMPVMDGYTATQQLRAAGCQLPIIALTAHAMATERARCLEAGCTEYASKPINQTTLVRLLSELVQPRAAA
jgi:PAS domain S-box-containing protein